MKQLIAFLLMPIAAILIIFKGIGVMFYNSFLYELVVGLIEGVKELQEKNYNFWAKTFKWESDK